MSDFPEKDGTVNDEQEPVSQTGADDEFSTVFSDPTEHKNASGKQRKKLLPVIIAAVLAVAVLAGGTVAVVKLIPEREDESSVPTIETITVLNLDSDDFKTVTVTNENGTFKLNVTVPVNCTASIYLPGDNAAREVKSGTHSFTKAI